VEKSNDKDLRKATSIKDIQEDPIRSYSKGCMETLVTDEKGICGNKRRALLVMATGKRKTRELQQHWSMYIQKQLGKENVSCR
jgi:type I restriction enzyme R subunit